MSNPESSKSSYRVVVLHNYEGSIFISLIGDTPTDPSGPRLMLPKVQMPPTIVAQVESGTQQFRVSFLKDDLFKFGQWTWEASNLIEPTQILDIGAPDEDANLEAEDIDYGFDPETDGSAYQSGTLNIDAITDIAEPPIVVSQKPEPEAPTVLCDLAEVHLHTLDLGNGDVTFQIGPYGSDEVWATDYQCSITELPGPMQDWIEEFAAGHTRGYCTVFVPDGMLGDPGEWEFDKIFNETPSGETPYYETVNHPAHYNWHPKVECIDVIEEFNNVNVAFAIKHLWRLGQKPGVDAQQDLDKAIWYLQREKRRLAQAKESQL